MVDGLECADIHAAKARGDHREPGRKEKTSLEDRLEWLMLRAFRKQRAQVLDLVSRYYPERKAKLPFDYVPEFDDEDMADLIEALTNGLHGGISIFGAKVQPAIDFTLTNREAAEFARKYAYELVKGINETTASVLKDAISSFVETPGMTLGQLESILPFDPVRAERVAIT